MMMKEKNKEKNNNDQNCQYDILKIEKLKEDQEEEEDKIILVYQGEKIRTKKSLLFTKCRYFRKHHEIFHQEEIDLSDKYSIETFRNFISSIESQEIAISKHTFFEYFEMSSRYEYHELYFSLEKYLHSVPFLPHILNDLICIDSLSNSTNSTNSSNSTKSHSEETIQGKDKEKENEKEKENMKKEEIIAKHFEECIQSGLLGKMKYSRLYRILSSPSLFIANHQHLFEFILSLFDEFQSNNEKNNGRENEKEKEKSILQSFTTFLNYEEMKEDEIQKLISHPLFCEFYQPTHSTTFIYQLLKQQESNEILLSTYEKRFQELEHKYEEQITQIMQIAQMTQNEKKNERILNQLTKEFSQQNFKIHEIETRFEEKEEEMKRKLSTFEQLFSKHKTEIQNEIETTINSTITSKIEESSKQMKNDYFDSLRQEIDSIKLKLNLILFECQYKNEPFEGIISELTKQTGSNVYESGLVDITGNRDYSWGSFLSLVDYNYTGYSYSSEDETNSYLCFDFKNHQISLSHYSIKNSIYPRHYLLSWKIEGSNDGNDWTVLDSHSNDRTLSSRYQIHTFEIKNRTQQKSRFRFIRLTQTGPSSGGCDCFSLTNIEFFGSYYI